MTSRKKKAVWSDIPPLISLAELAAVTDLAFYNHDMREKKTFQIHFAIYTGLIN